MPHAGCPCACSFCNQHSITGKLQQPDGADVQRAVQSAGRAIHDWPQDTEIAFFGGSFTLIDRAYMRALLLAAKQEVDRYGLHGIRISTRPDGIDRQVLQELSAFGVTAIELGAQSMNDEVLSENHRGHTAEDVRQAAKLIRMAGFEMGLQMMTGLYKDTDERAVQTAEMLSALRPDTMRIYPIVVLKHTQLAEWYLAGKYTPQSTEEAVSLCAGLIPIFEAKGIRVIRAGLHAQTQLEGEMLCGAYHPAFMELCRGEIFYHRLFRDLQQQLEKTGGFTYNVKVNPKNISIAKGHKKCNEKKLKAAGFQVCFLQDPSVSGEAHWISRSTTEP